MTDLIYSDSLPEGERDIVCFRGCKKTSCFEEFNFRGTWESQLGGGNSDLVFLVLM